MNFKSFTKASVAAVLLAVGLSSCSFNGLTHEDLYGIGNVESNSHGSYHAVIFDKEGYIKERINLYAPVKLARMDFTQQDALNAETWLAQYIVDEVVDNAGIDDAASWELWKKETLPKYTGGVPYEDLIRVSLQPSSENDLKFKESDIALHDVPFEIFYKDDQPRISSISLGMESINGGIYEGYDNFLVFNGIVRPTYNTVNGKETVNFKFEYLVGRDGDSWKLLGGSTFIVY